MKVRQDWRIQHNATEILSFREEKEFGHSKIITTYDNSILMSPPLQIKNMSENSIDKRAIIHILMPNSSKMNTLEKNFMRLIDDVDTILQEHILRFPNIIWQGSIPRQSDQILTRRFQTVFEYDKYTQKSIPICDMMKCEAFRKDIPIYDKRGRHIDNVSCESNPVNDQNCQVQLVYDGSTIKKTGLYQNNWIVVGIFLI
jgi:hypothetical protein